VVLVEISNSIIEYDSELTSLTWQHIPRPQNPLPAAAVDILDDDVGLAGVVDAAGEQVESGSIKRRQQAV